MKPDKKGLSSVSIFILYLLIGSSLIFGFRFMFPEENAPLPIFLLNWHSIRCLIAIFLIFPALLFSALVASFANPTENEYVPMRFSPRFLGKMMPRITLAISMSVLYALLFFLAYPLARSAEEDMRRQGELFNYAKNLAHARAEAGRWIEASQFIFICDGVWKNSPEIAELRADVDMNVEQIRLASGGTGQPRREHGTGLSDLPGQREPLTVTEALALSQTALDERRFMDAHWMATQARRIARPGSPEVAAASRLAALAWNRIERQEPSVNEAHAHAMFRLRLSGYEAMVSGDWIRAFYLFQGLTRLDPQDPDAKRFLAESERGINEIGFFIDEMEMIVGTTSVETVFSIPSLPISGLGNSGQARAVLRASSLSLSPNVAYGTGIEYMSFDSDANLLSSLHADYAKFLPITLGDRQVVLVQMRALDRHDSERRWEPTWNVRPDSGGDQDMAQITLGISYEDFLMLSRMRQGPGSMSVNELFASRELAEQTGHIPQVFEAEILNRLGSCLFILPMSIISIAIGWNFRARKRPHVFYPLMLPVLPVVCIGFTYICKIMLSIISSSLLLALGFSPALALFVIFLALFFLVSLVVLAGQRS